MTQASLSPQNGERGHGGRRKPPMTGPKAKGVIWRKKVAREGQRLVQPEVMRGRTAGCREVVPGKQGQSCHIGSKIHGEPNHAAQQEPRDPWSQLYILPSKSSPCGSLPLSPRAQPHLWQDTGHMPGFPGFHVSLSVTHRVILVFRKNKV